MNATPLELPPAGEDEPEAESSFIQIPPADLLISLTLVLTTLAAYAPVIRFGFAGLDDGKYVYENIHLRGGLTWQTLKWVFLSFSPDNWFPVTRLSLLVDYNLFGLRPEGYHAENLIIHSMATLLLFGFLRRATRVRWPCAMVAFTFALHPLHVESVAWIAERKDVLCAFFWFATLWAWLRYTERPGPGRLACALVPFSLGLMSKPMIVTLPFLLFLLDVWPFRRAFSRRLITEKIPFFALSLIVMAVTIAAQSSAGAVGSLDQFPLALRVENALVTVAIYIADTLWPARLWNPYAYPQSLPMWQAMAAAAGITAVSAITLFQRNKRPYLAFGWFWFLVTLLPVIGLLQVGPQARADRYMYVPMIGLSVMLVWGAAEALTHWLNLWFWASVAALGTAACLAMALRTSLQVQHWKNPEVMFRHAIDMDRRNYLAWGYLGLGLSLRTNPEPGLDSISCFRHMLQIRPDLAVSHNNLADALCNAGQFDEGIAEFHKAIGINPVYGPIHANLGEALQKMGHPNEAIDEYETALRLNPRLAEAQNDLGVLLWKIPRRSAEGLRHLELAVDIDPDYALAQSNLGEALMNTPGRAGDAVRHFREALRMNPELQAPHLGLAAILSHVPGMEEEAVAQLRSAQQLKSDAARRKALGRLEDLSTVPGQEMRSSPPGKP